MLDKPVPFNETNVLVALALITMDFRNTELYDERSFEVKISNFNAY